MGYLSLIDSIAPLHAPAMAAARARQDTLTKPAGSLGRLEELSIHLAGIGGTCPPAVPATPCVMVFAGDHGVCAQGISAFPPAVTPQMVLNFLAGGAAINVLARQTGARVVVVDAGVASDLPPAAGLINGKIAPGTADMSQGPAMTREQAIAALDLGICVANAQIAAGADLLACGDMGIGNTTPSAAITAVVTGRSPAEVTGPGTGLASERVRHKTEVIERAIAVNQARRDDPVGLLAAVGGFEVGAIAGAMIAAAAARVPMVLDGFISTAGALIACAVAPAVQPYLIAGHRSQEPGHNAALAHLGLSPLLDLRLRLGEGTGAVLAFPLVQAAARILGEMATFGEAGVSGGDA